MKDRGTGIRIHAAPSAADRRAAAGTRAAAGFRSAAARAGVRRAGLLRVVLLIALVAGALAGPAAVRAQGGEQVVDSLDALQRRIEALVGERLSALMPRQTYVLRALVLGHRVTVPRGAPAGGAYDLPGFRPSAGQSVAGDEKYAVDQIVVRIVLNEELRPEDVQYLRTIVPILADFRAERGDRLDLQALSAFNRGAAPPGQAGQAGQPGQVGQGGQAPSQPPGQPGAETGTPLSSPGQGGRPATVVDWIFMALLGLILVALLIVLLRVFLMPRAAAAPAYAAPSYATPPYAPPAYPPAPQQRPSAATAGGGASRARAAREESPSYAPDAEELEEQRYFESLKAGVVKAMFARPDIGRLLVQEWQSQTDKLSQLIHALGPQIARQALLPPLGVARYGDLEETVRSDKEPDRGKVIQTLKAANLFLISRELEHPEEIRVDPFAFLDELSRGQVGHLVKDEPVKVKAIVASRLKPEDMAFILEQYPKDMQLEIAVNIGNLHSLPLDMLDGVARDLAEKARHVPDARTVDIEGPTALVDLMGRASPDTSLYLLQAMKAKDRRLSEAVEKRFFLFDAIPLVPEDVLPQAVRGMPSAVVVQALQGAPEDLQRKVLMAFPEQARAGLVNSLRASKAAPAEVEEARRQVVARFQTLARQGKINLKQISDAWQAQAQPPQPAA